MTRVHCLAIPISHEHDQLVLYTLRAQCICFYCVILAKSIKTNISKENLNTNGASARSDLGQQPVRRTGRLKNQSPGKNLDINISVPVLLDVTKEV